MARTSTAGWCCPCPAAPSIRTCAPGTSACCRAPPTRRTSPFPRPEPGAPMKIKDVEQINHLLAELKSIQELISHAERAEPRDFELFVELASDASIKMSEEGASSTHYEGFAAS